MAKSRGKTTAGVGVGSGTVSGWSVMIVLLASLMVVIIEIDGFSTSFDCHGHSSRRLDESMSASQPHPVLSRTIHRTRRRTNNKLSISNRITPSQPSSSSSSSFTTTTTLSAAFDLENIFDDDKNDGSNDENDGNNSNNKLSSTSTSTTATTPLDWSSVIDDVYVITCCRSKDDGENNNNNDGDGDLVDRITSTKQILNQVNLNEHQITIKTFETDDEDRVRGCYTSHIQVLRDAIRANGNSKIGPPFSVVLESLFNDVNLFGKKTQQQQRQQQLSTNEGGRNILVFEDNLALGRDGIVTQNVLDDIASFVRNINVAADTTENEPWDILHLCYNPYVPNLQISKIPQASTTTSTEQVNNNNNKHPIVKLSSGVGSALGTTAYIINERAIRTILQQDDDVGYTGEAIPDVMAKLFPTSRYATNPTIFVRAPATKSLVNPQLDELRQILFQPTVVSLAQSLLVQTGLSTNTLLPLIIVSLLVASGGSFTTAMTSITQYIETGTLDGPWIIPVISVITSLFSLSIIVQGALLAPKPPPPPPQDEDDKDE